MRKPGQIRKQLLQRNVVLNILAYIRDPQNLQCAPKKKLTNLARPQKKKKKKQKNKKKKKKKTSLGPLSGSSYGRTELGTPCPASCALPPARPSAAPPASRAALGRSEARSARSTTRNSRSRRFVGVPAVHPKAELFNQAIWLQKMQVPFSANPGTN